MKQHLFAVALLFIQTSAVAQDDALRRQARIHGLLAEIEESERTIARLEAERLARAEQQQRMREILAGMVVLGMGTGLLAASRGKNPLPWFLGGTLLPILGLVIVYFAVGRTCRCQRLISWKALVCPHCRTEYPAEARLPRIALF